MINRVGEAEEMLQIACAFLLIILEFCFFQNSYFLIIIDCHDDLDIYIFIQVVCIVEFRF